MRFLNIKTIILSILVIINSAAVVNCNIYNYDNLTEIRDLLELIKNDQQNNSLINEEIYFNTKYDNGICLNQLINFVMALISGQFWALNGKL